MTVNVPQKLYAELEELAKGSGLKVGAYVRAVLMDAIKNGALVLNETTVHNMHPRWIRGRKDDARHIETLLEAANCLPASQRKKLEEMRKEGGHETLADLFKKLPDWPIMMDVDMTGFLPHSSSRKITELKTPRNPRT